jgi:hypothetical protein
LSDVPGAGVTDLGAEQRPARRAGGPLVLRVVSAFAALVLVAAVVAAVVLWNQHRSASKEQQERAAATNVAAQFALRMDTVDAAKFDSYTKSIDQLLTTKAKTKNKQVFDAIQKSYETAKVKGTGKVLLSAVGDSDADSATVLVVHDASVQTTQGNIEHHYRWSVEMVKVKSRWLVDDFNPVN